MSVSVETREAVNEIVKTMSPILDEKQKRILYGVSSKVLGYGGTAAVHEMTGAARNTIVSGKKESESISEETERTERIRQSGAGRKSAIEKIREEF